MPLLNIQLSFDDINVSAQVDDIVYYSILGSLTGGFNQTATSNTFLLGRIISISGGNIVVEYDDVINPQVTPPNSILNNAYISFAKDKSANTTSLVGYYMSVNFINDSRNKAELFSIGSEISESSK
tara:strand:- start:1210 stop:1587 length:378 start_codon:yes stop_codon:yes gene_type:complete